MTDAEMRAKILKLRFDAKRIHAFADRKWDDGKKFSSQSYHNDASKMTHEADELEKLLENT